MSQKHQFVTAGGPFFGVVISSKARRIILVLVKPNDLKVVVISTRVPVMHFFFS